MSYVITIQRKNDPLGAGEIERAVASDAEFVAVGTGCWRWTAAPAGSELFLDSGEDNLWTDGGRGSTAPVSLDKLRSLARALNAHMIGEEGEDLTECQPVMTQSSKSPGPLLTALITVALVPLIALAAIIRLPLILWHIVRPK